MIIFFLTNGIGDILMAIPALRRLIQARGVKGVAVVVSSPIHRQLLLQFITQDLRVLVRFDGRNFPNLRLWVKMLFLRADVVSAPLLSRKCLHIAFFASLIHRVQVPFSFIHSSFLGLQPSRLMLEHFPGHQVNFFVQFLAELDPSIDSSIVDPAEFSLLDRQASIGSQTSRKVPRIAVGVSCIEHERHKIPSPLVFARLLNALARLQPFELFLFGSSSDQKLIDILLSSLTQGVSVIQAIGLPIKELIGLLGECELGISGTTGQGHMMAAAGLPMLVMAGVTNPYESGPYVQRAAVLCHGYDCGPCYQETYRLGCARFSCMEALDVEEGAQLAKQLLDDPFFGLNWLFKFIKTPPVPVTTINKIHSCLMASNSSTNTEFSSLNFNQQQHKQGIV